jgi:hypothetical protein
MPSWWGWSPAGQQFEVTGRTAAGDWWQVCCVAGQSGWVFGELATVTNGDAAPIVADAPAVAGAPPATAAPAAQPEATATLAPPEAVAEAPVAPPDPFASSAGWFDPNAQYQIVHFKVLGLEENNGGIRDSSAQHLIFLTVLDQSGNGVDGAVVRNLVGDKSEAITGSKGSGKAEITMYYEPFKLAVASDPSGAVSSQVSNQMGLVFPHLPDLVGKLGDVNYEYGACPTHRHQVFVADLRDPLFLRDHLPKSEVTPDGRRLKPHPFRFRRRSSSSLVGAFSSSLSRAGERALAVAVGEGAAQQGELLHFGGCVEQFFFTRAAGLDVNCREDARLSKRANPASARCYRSP